jgi:hypothetical protein
LRKSAAEIEAGSARFARIFDFAAVVAVAGAGALLLADAVSAAVSAPLEEISAALKGAG